MRRGRGEEVRRDELGTLVYELVEGVLPISSGGTPDDRLDPRVSIRHVKYRGAHTPVW